MALNNLDEIRSKIRALISDVSQVYSESFTYSASAIFTLAEDNIITISDVEKNSVALGSGDYTFDEDTDRVTITASLSSGDIITIYYTYNKYSNTELNSYIKSSLVWLSIFDESCKDFEVETDDIYPTMNNKEEDLVALISSILIQPNYSEYRLPNLVVRYPRTTSKEDKIKKLIDNYTFGLGSSDILEWN